MSESPETLHNRLEAAEAALRAQQEERAMLDEITEIIELNPLLGLLGRKIEAMGNFDAYLINLADTPHDSLICEKIHLPPEYQGIEQTYLKYRFPATFGDANAECFRQRKPVFVNKSNIDQYSGDTRLRFERWLMESLAVIPIAPERESPLGTVMLFRRHGQVTPESIAAIEKLLRLFERQIKNALYCHKFTENLHDIEKAAQEQQRFVEFVSEINTLTSNEQIYEMLLKDFLQRFPFDLAAVLMREERGLSVKKIAIAKEQHQDIRQQLEDYFRNRPYELELADGASPNCFLQNRSLVFDDVMKMLHLPMSQKDRSGLEIMKTPRSFVIMPIRRAGRQIGLLWLISLEQPVKLSESQIKLIELLCAFIGTVLANAELYSLVHEQKLEIEVLNAASNKESKPCATRPARTSSPASTITAILSRNSTGACTNAAARPNPTSCRSSSSMSITSKNSTTPTAIRPAIWSCRKWPGALPASPARWT